MKRVNMFTVLALFVVYGQNNFSFSQERQEQKKERLKLSAQLLLKEAVKKTESQSIDSEAIYNEIDKNKAIHRQRNESEKISKKSVNDTLTGKFNDTTDRILKKLGLDTIDNPWCQDVKKAIQPQADASIKKNIESKFPEAFKQAREKAISGQRAKLEDFATPEGEVDLKKVENNDTGLQNDLRQRSQQKYKEVILDENEELITQKISEIIADCRRQYEEQSRIVESSQGGGKITRQGMIEGIIEDITRYQATLKRKYPLFPSMKERIPARAQQAVLKKFLDWLNSKTFIIEKAKIRQEIESKISEHRVKATSFKKLEELFKPEIQEKAFQEYASKLSQKEGQELRGFLESQESTKEPFINAVRKGLVSFDEARKEISQKEFKEAFPNLADQSWRLIEQEIESRYNASKDIAEIVKKFFGNKTPLFLEEVDNLVNEAIASLAKIGDDAILAQMSLVDGFEKEARANNTRLEGLLKEFSSEDLQSPAFPQTSGKLEMLIEQVTNDIQEKWTKNSLAKDYKNLFGKVKSQIRKVVKDLLPLEIAKRKAIEQQEAVKEAIRQAAEKVAQAEKERQDKEKARRQEEQKKAKARQQEEEKKKSEGVAASEGAKPGVKQGLGGEPGKGGSQEGMGGGEGKGSGEGEGTGGGAVPESIKKFTPDILIDIDVSKEGLAEVKIEFLKIAQEPISFQVRPQNFALDLNQPLRNVVLGFRSYFNKVAKPQEETEIFVLTRVFHDIVPYGIVFYIRENIRLSLKGVQDKKIKVLWYDGRFEKDQEIDPQIREWGAQIRA